MVCSFHFESLFADQRFVDENKGPTSCDLYNALLLFTIYAAFFICTILGLHRINRLVYLPTNLPSKSSECG